MWFQSRIPDQANPTKDFSWPNLMEMPNTHSDYLLENTTIKENRAQRTGGMGILSLNSPVNTKRIENLVLFKSCKFFGNESPNGAAFAFQNLVHSGFDPSTSIIFEDVSIEQNRQTESSSINTAVAYLSSVNLTIRGKSQFIENVGIALLLSESIITVEGDLRFINNSGIGISLLGLSNIVLRSGSALVFKGNRAANKGGAILSDLYPSYTNLSRIIYDCFLWFEELSRDCRFFGYCQNVPQPNATIVFEDNHAPVGGTIYGSTLSTCPWAVYPNGTKPSSGVAFLQQLPSVTFNPSVLDSSVVSTDAFYLVRNISQHIYAIPGKEMDLNITALDLLNQSVSTTIRSSFCQYYKVWHDYYNLVTRENLQNAFDLVKESLDLFYNFRNGTNVGIFLGDTSDLQARNMIVQNTPGIGMVAINLMGESDMSNVTFTNNNVPDVISSCGVGGGLFILYADYHNHTPNKTPQLTISASLFKLNYNCIFESIFESQIGIGGGLSITLSHNSFPVDISMNFNYN